MSDARERILAATLALIGEHGLGGVTNRAVAREAGVSPGSLSYHFPEQTALLREALLVFVTREAERLEHVADAMEGTTPDLETVAAGVQAVVQSADRGEQLAQMELYLQAARDPELRDVAARAYAAYDHAAGVVLSALGVPDPEPLIPALIALVDGYELRRMALGAPADPALTHALAAMVRAASHPAG
jgi:AcrR family transcriptional regulator